MAEGYLGDLNKTGIMYSLFKVPFEQRDEIWRQNFFNNVPEASFRSSNPQVMRGPDGFPYFTLLLPEPGKPFQCFVLKNMKDDFLLKQGLGVVIEPGASGGNERPQWVFSYGDILGFHLKGNFSPFVTAPEAPPGYSKETIEKEEQIMVGQPSESFFPAVARQVIRKFLEAQEIKDPHVLLMQRDVGGKPSQQLAFDFDPQKLGSDEKVRAVMTWLSWFLPRGLAYCAVSHATFAKNFAPL